MYAIQGNGYEEELQAFSCSNNSTVNFRARLVLFSQITLNLDYMTIYRMIAVERRQPSFVGNLVRRATSFIYSLLLESIKKPKY